MSVSEVRERAIEQCRQWVQGGRVRLVQAMFDEQEVKIRKTQTGAKRGKTLVRTPKELLQPLLPKLQGVWIQRNHVKRFFRVSNSDPVFPSKTAHWEGPRARRTEAEALDEVR